MLSPLWVPGRGLKLGAFLVPLKISASADPELALFSVLTFPHPPCLPVPILAFCWLLLALWEGFCTNVW